jgi:hypothetical protein
VPRRRPSPRNETRGRTVSSLTKKTAKNDATAKRTGMTWSFRQKKYVTLREWWDLG